LKKEKLAQALNEISDSHIAEAAAKKRRRPYWLGALAAVIALVLVFRYVEIPLAVHARAVALASDFRFTQRPKEAQYPNREDYRAALNAWLDANATRADTATAALTDLNTFFKESCRTFLSGTRENALYSPLNAYIGLAMAAELTGGNTHRQLLDTLGTEDVQALRSQTSALWESVYKNDGNEICTLANSLWLDNSLDFNQSVMDILGHDYYCSVYQRNLNGSRAPKDIGAWLNNNTGGLLKSYTQEVQLPEETILAIYSTIYFQSKWGDEFRASNNTQDVFHAPTGDTTCTYMNAKLRQMDYYWGDSFGAVSLWLNNRCSMWFILPDPDKTIADVLAEGQYLDMVYTFENAYENTKYMKVNLSVPKFDISTQTDLRSGLESMGITDLFDFKLADFSPAFEGMASITSAKQSVRVAIDEQGVTAAAYIELPGAGAAQPPEEIIDFVLDRPFLFLITGVHGEPLFAGTVNQP